MEQEGDKVTLVFLFFLLSSSWHDWGGGVSGVPPNDRMTEFDGGVCVREFLLIFFSWIRIGSDQHVIRISCRIDELWITVSRDRDPIVEMSKKE